MPVIASKQLSCLFKIFISIIYKVGAILSSVLLNYIMWYKRIITHLSIAVKSKGKFHIYIYAAQTSKWLYISFFAECHTCMHRNLFKLQNYIIIIGVENWLYTYNQTIPRKQNVSSMWMIHYWVKYTRT